MYVSANYAICPGTTTLLILRLVVFDIRNELLRLSSIVSHQTTQKAANIHVGTVYSDHFAAKCLYELEYRVFYSCCMCE